MRCWKSRILITKALEFGAHIASVVVRFFVEGNSRVARPVFDMELPF